MESKPRIIFNGLAVDMRTSLRERLDDCSDYHLVSEAISSQIMETMYQKTKMYDGGKKMDNLYDQATKSYYEGVGRKADRIPGILKRIRASDDDSAVHELVDTLVDIAGYAILSLNDLKPHMEKLK